MRILVTGSEGFIGSHLVEKLTQDGHDLTCLVLYNSFNSWGWLEQINKNIKKNIRIITGDIRDEFFVKNLLKRNFDVVINLAALIGIPYSYRSPNSYFNTNLYGLLNILNASLDSNISKIIHTSTSEVYGTPKYIPIDEEHIVSAQSPYAASKISADQLALSYYRTYKLPVTILRPFNTFGPRQSLRAIIPSIITQVLRGNIIKIGNLHTTRDLTFVNDTTNAFSLSLKGKNNIGEIINIGSGFEISIKNLALKIAKIIGKKIYFKKEKKRIRPKNSEVERLFAKNKKAKKILNWSPEFSKNTEFDKALKITIEWFSKDENLKNYKTNILND